MAWSIICSVGKTADKYKESNYREMTNTSWFQRSWWSFYEAGWKYYNDTGMSVKVTEITFLACAGHSNGKYYCGETHGQPTLITWGHGCEFTSDIYVVDSQGNHVGEKKNVGRGLVESISEFNCYYNGYGNVAQYENKTSFGSRSYFTGLKARHPIPMTYVDAPVIPPGGMMFVTVHPDVWYTNSSDALLVMEGSGASFTSEIEPVDNDYIYVFYKKEGDAQPKWHKERKAYMKTNSGWEEMEGK